MPYRNYEGFKVKFSDSEILNSARFSDYFGFLNVDLRLFKYQNCALFALTQEYNQGLFESVGRPAYAQIRSQ